MPLSTFLWGSTARQITTVCAMIAAIGGAIVANAGGITNCKAWVNNTVTAATASGL